MTKPTSSHNNMYPMMCMIKKFAKNSNPKFMVTVMNESCSNLGALELQFNFDKLAIRKSKELCKKKLVAWSAPPIHLNIEYEIILPLTVKCSNIVSVCLSSRVYLGLHTYTHHTTRVDNRALEKGRAKHIIIACLVTFMCRGWIQYALQDLIKIGDSVKRWTGGHLCW